MNAKRKIFSMMVRINIVDRIIWAVKAGYIIPLPTKRGAKWLEAVAVMCTDMEWYEACKRTDI